MCQICDELGITEEMTDNEVAEIYAGRFNLTYVGIIPEELMANLGLANACYASLGAMMLDITDPELLKLLEPAKDRALTILREHRMSVAHVMDLNTKFPGIDIGTEIAKLADDANAISISPSGDLFVGTKKNLMEMYEFFNFHAVQKALGLATSGSEIN